MWLVDRNMGHIEFVAICKLENGMSLNLILQDIGLKKFKSNFMKDTHTQVKS